MEEYEKKQKFYTPVTRRAAPEREFGSSATASTGTWAQDWRTPEQLRKEAEDNRLLALSGKTSTSKYDNGEYYYDTNPQYYDNGQQYYDNGEYYYDNSQQYYDNNNW